MSVQESFKKAEIGQTLWDRGELNSTRGLHLRCTPKGKIFFLYYRTKTGRQRRPKIGVFGEITLFEARKIAKDLLLRVSQGEDPKGKWDEKREEMTVDELYHACWKAHWSHKRYKESGWAQDVKCFYEGHIKKVFGKARLSEITPIRVRTWHDAFKNSSPYAGNRAKEVLGKMFRWAEEQEIKPQNTNPCYLVKSHPEAKRKRYASEEEIQTFSKLLEAESEHSPQAVAFIYLLIFSGSRPSAIERASWEELSRIEKNGMSYGVLNFYGKTTGKTGDFETVILPPHAMRVIDSLPKNGPTICGIKFPRRLWRKLREKAGCADLWARDWRRTFATLGMGQGVSMEIISELFNHRSTETTAIYAKVAPQARMQAALTIANQIEKIMTAKSSAQE